MSVELLYGIEFWNYLELAIPRARQHIFLLSAYAREDDINNLIKVMPDVPYLIVIRDDCKLQKENNNVIYVDKDIYHAKVYVIDNEIVIGSQNLYKISKINLDEKRGEVSVKFCTHDSINIVYQSLILILKGEYESFFDSIVYESAEHWEMTYEQASNQVAGDFYFKSFESQSFNRCPYCNNTLICNRRNQKMRLNCTNCDFMIEIRTYYNNDDRPWESTRSVWDFTCPEALKSFLKLHMYLAEQMGESASFDLLMSLKILGNLHNLDVDKRIYKNLVDSRSLI